MNPSNDRLTSNLLKPLQGTSAVWFLWVAFLATIVVAGLFSWFMQMWSGFGLTGIRWPVYWGFLITDFVFWIGISHAGTLISAILRLVSAEWRRPVTRCAEFITAFALRTERKAARNPEKKRCPHNCGGEPSHATPSKSACVLSPQLWG